MKDSAVTPFEDTIDLRREIIQACRYLSDLGFCIGTWGNVSVRVEEGLLITPSAVDYATMADEDLVVVDWEGKQLSGRRPPSSEMHLHRVLLLRRPDMGAVVHTHSPYASSFAAAHESIPVSSEDMAQIIGGEVRCSRYVPGAQHLELAEAACQAMGDVTTAVLLSNHGPVTLGRTLTEAVTATRVLEKAAMMFVIANSLGGCTSIPREMVGEERYRFVYRYGRKGEEPINK